MFRAVQTNKEHDTKRNLKEYVHAEKSELLPSRGNSLKRLEKWDILKKSGHLTIVI